MLHKGRMNSPEIFHQVTSQFDMQIKSYYEMRDKVVTCCKTERNKIENIYSESIKWKASYGG